MNAGRLLELDPRWHAALISLLLSGLAVALGLTPNPDGYTYLRTAEIFLEDGLRAAFAHYHWASYSLLIALFQYLPGVDLFAAAQLVNAVLYALLTVVFMTLLREIDPSRRMAWIAAVTILVYPHLNEFRFTLIRDIGFLALSLLGLLYLARYYRDSGMTHAAGFCAACVAAALFRVEALVFLLLAPFALLCDRSRSWRARWHGLLQLHGFAAGLALALFVAFFAAGINLLALLGDAANLYQPFLQQSERTFFGDTSELTQAIFTEHAALFSERYTILLLVTGLGAILITKIIESIGTPYLMVLAWGAWQRRIRLPRHLLVPGAFYLLLAFLVPLAFILLTRFMTTRYTMLLCTLLVLLVPLIVERAWRDARREGWTRRFAWVVGLLAVYCAFDSHVSFGDRKTYLPETVDWINRNTNPDAPLRTNLQYIGWATGRVEAYDRITGDISRRWIENAPDGAIVVVENRGEHDALLERAVDEGLLLPLEQFSDADRQRLFIYRAL